MMLRNSMVALLAAGVLLSGCEAQKPSSSSDNAVPPSTVTPPAGVVGTNPDGLPIFAVPTAYTAALWAPFKGDSASIPFPVDLLFDGSSDGTLNIPDVANSDTNATPSMTTATGIQSAADPMVALNTMSGFSTTAMLTIPFSAAIDPVLTNLTQGVRIFQMKGNAHAGMVLKGDGSEIDHELAFGVDFVASLDPTGKTLAILPLKPLKSSTTYRIVVVGDANPLNAAGTQGLKDSNGNYVGAYGAYQAQRAGGIALFPQIGLYESALATYTAAHPFPPTVLQGAPAAVPLVAGNAGNIALSYSVTTQNLTAALQQAQGVVAAASAPTISVTAAPTPFNSAIQAAPPTGFGAANTEMYSGTISGMVSFLNPSDPAHSIWNKGGNNLSLLNSFAPDAKGTFSPVPVLITAPSATADAPDPAPAGVTCAQAFPSGYPVVIFQHGITSNRGTLLALAGALTRACTVGVAIDLPEHGILPTDAKFGFLAKQLPAGISANGPAGERLVASGAGVPSVANPAGCVSGTSVDVGGGDYRCDAGDSYINLANLANSRDVLRQSVIDLDSLYRALTAGANTGLPSIDTSKISYVGISLGSIVGETFVATLGNGPIAGSLTSAVFNVGGGGIAKLLDGSPTFEPIVTAGLAGQGVTKPSSDYESFMIAAQTLVDSADPINYATTLNTLKSTTPILFQEVVGDGTATNKPDQVVPNNVFGSAAGSLGGAWSLVSGSPVQAALWATQNSVTNPSALGGTDSLVQGTAFLSLATAYQSSAIPAGACTTPTPSGAVCDLGVGAFFGIGLPQLNDNRTSPLIGTSSGLVRFAQGEHSSLLDPTASLKATVVMQTQAVGFVASGGTQVAGELAADATCAAMSGGALTDCSGAIANWTSALP